MTTRTARKSKGKKTTEVRKKKTEDEKARDKANQNAPARRLGPEVVEMYQRSTSQDTRGRRNRNVSKGRSRKPKHKKRLYASPARVASMYLLANRTKGLPTKIEATYHEVGRNGRWILEVRNSPYQNDLTATDWPKFLKGLGLWWDRNGRYWVLDSGSHINVDAMLARGGDPFDGDGRINPKIVAKNRRVDAQRAKQKKAWPAIKAAVTEYNRAVRNVLSEARDTPDDPADFARWVSRHQRMIDSLADKGVQIDVSYKDQYGYIQGPRKTYITGNTFPIKDVMKAFGFRWTSDIATGWSQRLKGSAWAMPLDHFTVIGDEWMAEAIRALSTR